MRAGIVISARIKEIGGAGIALERSLLEAADRGIGFWARTASA